MNNDLVNGQTAVIVLIVAMVLTGGVGYFLNFEEQDTTKTVYSPIGDMGAIFSANSEKTMVSEPYNSIYNVTGWSGDGVNYQLLSSGVNQYPYVPGGDELVGTPTTLSGSVTTYGYTIHAERDIGVMTLQESLTSDTVYPTYTNIGTNDISHGGYAQKLHYGVYPVYATPGSTITYWDKTSNICVNDIVIGTYSNNVAATWVSLAEINPTVDATYIYRISNLSTSFIVNPTTSMTTSGSGTNITYNYNISGDIITDAVRLDYIGGPTAQWRLVSGTGQNLYTGSADTIYLYNPNGLVSWNMTLSKYQHVDTQYIDPQKYVSLSGSNTWSAYNNNNTLIPTEVTLLFKGTGNILINGTQYLSVTQSGSTYSVNGTAIGEYIGLVIRLVTDSRTIDIMGILSEAQPTLNPTIEYTTSGITVPIYVTAPVPVIYSLTINSLGTVQAYIQQTYILSDPTGILWTNPNVNLSDYFPDNTNNLRVLIQGVVRDGNTLSINGVTYLVTDGTITVGETKVQIDGMAIDYVQGNVTITRAVGKFVPIDAGEINSYNLSGTGVWYFSATASSISTVQTTENVWNPGWSIDMTTTLMIFIAFVFTALLILGTRFRDNISMTDVGILIFSIVIALSLVVV